MKFEPLRDIVLIERDETVKKSTGGIIMTGTAAEQPPEGVVLSVGPGRLLEDGTLIVPSVKEGDRVVFAANSGYPIKLSEMPQADELVVMTEGEIIGILRA